jgi:hypothetical protein
MKSSSKMYYISINVYKSNEVFYFSFVMLYLMSKASNKKKCYLTDPHLFYHLESPAKIVQLL